MDRILVDRFRGMYTNVDQGSLNPEYLSRAVNTRFKAGYIESRGFTQSDMEIGSNVVYCSPISLDEDKYSNRYDEGVLTIDYQQIYSYYLLTVKKETENDITHYRVYLDDDRLNDEIDSVPVKVLDSFGGALILTEKGTLYELRKINRYIWQPNGSILFRRNLSIVKVVKEVQPTSIVGIEFSPTDELANSIPVTLHQLNPDNDDTPRTKDGFTYSVWAFEAKDSEGNVVQIPGFDPNYLMFYRITFSERTYMTMVDGKRELWAVDPSPLPITKIFEPGEIAYVGWYDSFQVFNIVSVNEGYNITRVNGSSCRFIEYPYSIPPEISDRIYHGNSSLFTYQGVLDYIAGVNTMLYRFEDEEGFAADQRYSEFVVVLETERGNFVVENIELNIGLGKPFVIKAELLSSMVYLDAVRYSLFYRMGITKEEMRKDDFERCAIFEILQGKNTLTEPMLISNLTPDGIFLSQTIGTLFDSKTYKPIVKFTDYVEINGISYCVSNRKVYHSSIGGGEIMVGVFHDYIPEIEAEFIEEVNGDLGAFDQSLEIVSVSDSRDGYLLFSSKDSMSFIIRDRDDLSISPEGILIHTNKGIYATNGYERKLISEPINDVVEKHYNSGNIFYDDYLNVLYYSSDGGSFKFDFDTQSWSELSISLKGQLSVDDEGILYLVRDGKLYKLTEVENILSYLATPKFNLEYPGIAKIPVYYVVEFEGKVIYQDQEVESSLRKAIMFGVPVTQRIPSSSLDFVMLFEGKVYSIEIWYDILGEFRNANFVPTQQTNPERIAEVKQFLEGIGEQAQTGA